MPDIVKNCINCGPLTIDKCRKVKINNRGYIPIICLKCSREKRRDYYSKNKEKLSISSIAWKNKYPEKAKEAKKKWQKENWGRHLEVSREYRERNRERINFQARLRDYGISVDDYLLMKDNQENRCAICRKEEIKIWRGKKTELCLDHCHKTNKLRELLCFKCNLGLGAYHDNIQLLQNAIKYLKKHQPEPIS